MTPLNNISQVRSIDWNRAYLWDIRFLPPDNPPAPFDSWFPAVDVDDMMWSLTTYNPETPNFPLAIPTKAMQVRNLGITFQDDVYASIEMWLEEWVNGSILNRGECVSTLFEIIRRVEVLRLSLDKKPIFRCIYEVYPTDTFTFTGRSESISNQYQTYFNVVSYNKDKNV